MCSREMAARICDLLRRDPGAFTRWIKLIHTRYPQKAPHNVYRNDTLHPKPLVPVEVARFVEAYRHQSAETVAALVKEEFGTEISFSLIHRVRNGLP